MRPMLLLGYNPKCQLYKVKYTTEDSWLDDRYKSI